MIDDLYETGKCQILKPMPPAPSSMKMSSPLCRETIPLSAKECKEALMLPVCTSLRLGGFTSEYNNGDSFYLCELLIKLTKNMLFLMQMHDWSRSLFWLTWLKSS